MAKISNLETHNGYWLRMVSNAVSQSFARGLEETGITVAEWVMLRLMFDHAEGTAPSHLAEVSGLTRGAVSKLVERLVEKKLATRAYRKDDRRQQDVALTAAGRRVVPELVAIADRNDEEFFSVLSATERKTLLATLKKLSQAHGLKSVPTE